MSEAVNEVWVAHVGDEVRGYRGNLTLAVNVADNGWLSATNDPNMIRHFEALREYLAEAGEAAGLEDTFLLRVGLTVPGMQRGIIPPLMVLEENRGGLSQRRMREAEGQIRRLREVLSIGRRFIPKLPQDTEQAIRHLADISERHSHYSDSEWLARFGELSHQDARTLEERALSCLARNAQDQVGIQVLQRLASFRTAPLSTHTCNELIDRNIYYPSILFRDSGPAIARRLIGLAEDPTRSDNLNIVLLALAWNRSTDAVDAFANWRRHPPEWASQLYVPPATYLRSGGLCLTSDGRRRDLVSQSCFRLEPRDDMEASFIPCQVPIDDACHSCRGSYAYLYDFSHVDDEYFEGEFADVPRQLVTCLHCACYSTVFTHYHSDGTYSVSTGAESFESESDWRPTSCQKTLSTRSVPYSTTAEAFLVQDASTLGGAPMWLQDTDFPACRECGELMFFIAQHDNSSVGAEGIYYAFLCAACHVLAVNYQQT